MNFDWISTSVGFLIGAATGGAGGYYASKYTDRRRESETDNKVKIEFLATVAKMPNFIDELKKDLTEHPDVREFFVLQKGAMLGGANIPRFRYEYEVSSNDNLLNKMQILENMGYVIDVTPGNAPIYRMTEEFLELLQKYG